MVWVLTIPYHTITYPWAGSIVFGVLVTRALQKYSTSQGFLTFHYSLYLCIHRICVFAFVYLHVRHLTTSYLTTGHMPIVNFSHYSWIANSLDINQFRNRKQFCVLGRNLSAALIVVLFPLQQTYTNIFPFLLACYSIIFLAFTFNFFSSVI